MLQAAKFQRLYILLRPCSKGGGGYARLEQARGKYTLTVNAHGFSPSEEGIRVLLAARDEGGGAAVCDLGSLPVSDKGQSSLKREVAAMPGGLPLSSYSALCIAKDWPNPRLMLLGALEENNSLSSYLIGETVCRYLSVPTNEASESTLAQEKPVPPVSTPTPSSEPRPSAVPVKTAAAAPAAIPAAAPSAQSTAPAITVAPASSSVPSAAKPFVSPIAPIKTDMLPDIIPKETIPFPLARAVPTPKSASEPAAARPAVSLPANEPPEENPELAVFTSAMERIVFPPDVPAAGPLSGRPPVNGLPRLHWPAAVKELENYFSTYPPFAPFDAPGWRFVQVPMAAGSTIPYYAVGMLARDGKVTQVAYAVPGERGALPPPGFSGYRWQQGRNGQGYWTLWKRA
jgi:hypothetical protein